MNFLGTSAAKSALCASLLAVLSIGVPLDAAASAIRTDAAFTANTLARNDDGSTGLVNISFELCFFGVRFTQLYVNNNGNVTFNAPLATFTPSLSILGTPIIAPFFADVDTRNTASGVTQYGSGLITTATGVHQAFGVNWINVGYYNTLATHLNSFQLVLIQRTDVAGNPQDFDIEFNYETITWESGQASGSNADGNCNNLPSCVSALVGYGNGATTQFALPGSLVHGAFMNGGSNQLQTVSINSNNVVGRITTECRNCAVAPPITVPEPATVALFGIALGGLALRRRRNS